MLPVRVVYGPDAQFFGYGPNGQEIEAMSSVHRKGREPSDRVSLFGHIWETDSGYFMWDGYAYLTWKRVD